MKKLSYNIPLLSLFALSISSCATNLKPYERQYINDPEMSMAGSSPLKFQYYTQNIREGASAAQGKKGNGGCGCN